MLANVSCVLLTAPADGIAPALLLSITDSKRRTLGQYMFNAPEGISRLVLEHKVRPGLHFKALFLSGSDAAEAGGLGGMVLRLKQDGVGAVQLVGPTGTNSCLSGLKSFISWQHPHISVTEPQQQQQVEQPASSQAAGQVTYADRNIQVSGFCTAANGSNESSSSSSSPHDAWQAPPWLSPSAVIFDNDAAAAAATAAPSAATAADTLHGCTATSSNATTTTTSSSSSSSADDGTSRDTNATSSSSSSSSLESEGVTNNSGDTTGHVVIERYAGSSDSSSSSSNSKSESETSSSSSGSESSSSSKSDTDSSDSNDSEGNGDVDEGKQQVHQVEAEKQQQLFSALDNVLASSTAAAAAGNSLAAASAAGCAARALTQARQGNTAAAAGTAGVTAQQAADMQQQQQNGEHVFKRKRQPEQHQQQQQFHKVKKSRVQAEQHACCCEDADCGQPATPAVDTSSQQSRQQQQQQVLGYICHILLLAATPQQPPPAAPAATTTNPGSSVTESYGQLFAVFYCRNKQQLAQLQQQPAVSALIRCSSRVLFVCHVTTAELARSAEYQEWIEQLPGQQIMMETHHDRDLDHTAAAAAKDGSSSSSSDHSDGDDDLGIRASARVLSRLCLVSPEMYPLPHCLSRQQVMTRDDVMAVVQQAQQQQQQPPADGDADNTQPKLVTTENSVHDRHHNHHHQQQQLTASQSQDKVVYGKLLQQFSWQGLTLQPSAAAVAAAAASQYQYEWQQWADLDYEKQQQQQAQLESLNIKQLQQELLEQRPKLQQLLPAVQDRFAAALQQLQKQQQRQQQQALVADGDDGKCSSKKATNKSAAEALRARLANKSSQVQQNAPALAARDCVEVPPTAAAAATEGDSENSNSSDDVNDESSPAMLTQPWASDTSVMFLGTGSAEPSKYRGPSAILLKIAPDSSSSSSSSGKDLSPVTAAKWVLLDAGEGTWGAIKRHMGQAAAAAVIANLGLIWISHKHADHMLGVPALLQAKLQISKQQQQQGAEQGSSSSNVLQQPLLLVGPRELLSWLQHLPGHGDWQCMYRFVPLTAFSGAVQSGSTAVQQQNQVVVPPPRPPPTPPPAQQQQQQMFAQQQQQQQHLMWQQQQQYMMMQQQQQMFMMQQGYAAPWFHPQMQQFDGMGMQPMQPSPMQHHQVAAAAAAAAINANGMAMHRNPSCHQQSSRTPQHQQSDYCNPRTSQPQQQQQQQQQDSSVHHVMSEVLGLASWQSVAVRHCAGAHGLVLTHKQGWKLVYSGDTRPCAALTAAGAGATLLIHESTFDNDLVHHARAKGHSTMQEALQVAADMKAYRTVLTHFSQRYPRLPAGYPADVKPWRSRPLLTVDGAVVNFALLPVLPALMPAVAAALEEIEEGAAT